VLKKLKTLNILSVFQDRRAEKKVNKKAFTAEKIRQDKEMINLKKNLKTVKIM